MAKRKLVGNTISKVHKLEFSKTTEPEFGHEVHYATSHVDDVGRHRKSYEITGGKMTGPAAEAKIAQGREPWYRYVINHGSKVGDHEFVGAVHHPDQATALKHAKLLAHAHHAGLEDAPVSDAKKSCVCDYDITKGFFRRKETKTTSNAPVAVQGPKATGDKDRKAGMSTDSPAAKPDTNVKPKHVSTRPVRSGEKDWVHSAPLDSRKKAPAGEIKDEVKWVDEGERSRGASRADVSHGTYRIHPKGGSDGGVSASYTPKGGATQWKIVVGDVHGKPVKVEEKPKEFGTAKEAQDWAASHHAGKIKPKAEEPKAEEPKKDETTKSMCNCCHCGSVSKGEEPMTTNKIENIFKGDCVCPDCGGVQKGSKKADGAHALGNEDHPHKGKKGGQVEHPRGGKKGKIDKKVTPSNPTVEKAMFAVNTGFAAVEYAGLSEDNMLSKSIEMNLKPGAGAESGLYVPPARNLAMEQESARIAKADDDSSSEPEEPEESDDDEGSDDSEE